MRRRIASPARQPCTSPVVSLLGTLVLLVLLASMVPTTRGERKSYEGWRVLRVSPSTADRLQLLELRMRDLGPDVGEVLRRGPSADVLVRPDALDDVLHFLDDLKMPARVHVTNVGEEIRRERSLEILRSGTPKPRRPDVLRSYLHFLEIEEFLDDLAERYPEFVNVTTYGESYEGRPLKVIQISKGGGGNRPVIFVDAGIHAREWISPSMALYIIQQLVENPDNEVLLARVDWHIIPLVNPDGYEFSHATDRMWRKTRSMTHDPFCYGADPNRNFDYFWGVVGVTWDPCKETYPGHAPFSEIESEALALYGLSLQGRLRLYVSIHSYGGVFIHPWGYSYRKPEDSHQLEALGMAVGNAVKAAGIRKFEVGNCFETLGELAAGGSDDWMKAVAGANFSYTLEMPAPSFTTPAADIAKYVVPTFQGFRVMGLFIDHVFGQP